MCVCYDVAICTGIIMYVVLCACRYAHYVCMYSQYVHMYVRYMIGFPYVCYVCACGMVCTYDMIRYAILCYACIICLCMDLCMHVRYTCMLCYVLLYCIVVCYVCAHVMYVCTCVCYVCVLCGVRVLRDVCML